MGDCWGWECEGEKKAVVNGHLMKEEGPSHLHYSHYHLLFHVYFGIKVQNEIKYEFVTSYEMRSWMLHESSVVQFYAKESKIIMRNVGQNLANYKKFMHLPVFFSPNYLLLNCCTVALNKSVRWGRDQHTLFTREKIHKKIPRLCWLFVIVGPTRELIVVRASM